MALKRLEPTKLGLKRYQILLLQCSFKTIILQQKELVFTLKKKTSKTKCSGERKLLKYQVFKNR